ncbi:MAG: GNAT family N-acetyltransferase [Ktedonobacterales bacterium]
MTLHHQAHVRPARAVDREPILDLLTEYDLPWSYFAPFYASDPTFRPEQSWVAEEAGQLLAHARIFERYIRMGPLILRIAGIGNVITRKSVRGRGLFGRLIRGMLAGISHEDYAYSLLWTHLPELYARYGWTPLAQTVVSGRIRSAGKRRRIVPFAPEDLVDIMRLYEQVNTGRTGPTLRTPEYWRGQMVWLQESAERFLLTRTQTGRLAGYVRFAIVEGTLTILELGTRQNSVHIGRALLAEASAGGQPLRARLPPSLLALLPDGEIQQDGGLMGRTVHLGHLLSTFQPLWQKRLTAAGVQAGMLDIATSSGVATLHIQQGELTITLGSANLPEPSLNEANFGHLLFHGFDRAAEQRLSERHDAALLCTLFPTQDFILWQADDF